LWPKGLGHEQALVANPSATVINEANVFAAAGLVCASIVDAQQVSTASAARLEVLSQWEINPDGIAGAVRAVNIFRLH
jgi:hypothetical protein